MNRTIKIIIAIIIAAAGIGVFMYALNMENSQTESGQASGDVVISEFMASNRGVIADDKGDFSDWIEIHNTSDKPVDLTNYGLSDDPDQIKWMFPSVVLKPDGYLLIFASGNTVVAKNAPYFHTEFRLSSKEGGIYLTNKAGKKIDSVEYPEQQNNKSMGRDPQSGKWVYLNAPSPGFPNDEAGVAEFAATREVEDVDLLITEVMASNNTTIADASGEYNDYIEIYNAGSDTIDLTGFALSDNPDNAGKWRFPEMSIAPGEYVVVFASGKGMDSTNTEAGEIHTSFRISAYNETVILTSKLGMKADEVTVSEVPSDNAFMRELGADGTYTDNWAASDMPSPGFANNEEGHTLFEQNNTVAAGPVVINEVMTSGNTLLPEEDGECYDWIEIANRGSEPVDISGYSLTDDTGLPTKWRFPKTVIEPGGFVTVLASGLGDVPDDELKKKYIHTNFRLSAAGEVLALYDADTKLVDRYRIKAMPYGVSVGRNGDESALFYFTQPTPNEANSNASAGIVDTPQPSMQGGSYDDTALVALTCDTPNAKIYYTTDGTVPTQQSSEYVSPIELGKTGMIRTRAFKSGFIDSAVGTETYFINETHSLPLLSIVTDPKLLFDPVTGIYELGPDPQLIEGYTNHYEKANYLESGKESERPASFEVFNEEGRQVFSQNIAIRIQGGFSRDFAQKSFAIFARTEYGPGVMAFPFFENRPFTEYEAIQLRQGGQDQNVAKIKEAVALSLVEGQGFHMLYQAIKPYVVYINGEYWGVYFMQEKRNEDFIAAHEGHSDRDKMNIMWSTSRLIKGSSAGYKELLEYVRTHDMSTQENHEYLAARLDTDSFMDVMINEIWVANSDYGNMQFYQLLPDDKWKQIYYDFCWTFGSSEYPDAVHPTLKRRTDSDVCGSDMFNALLAYKPWRDKFVERFAWALDEVYDPERVLAEIDKQANLVRDEIAAEREKFDCGSFAGWEKHVERMRNFASKRNAVVVSHLKEQFSLSSEQKKMLDDAIAED